MDRCRPCAFPSFGKLRTVALCRATPHSQWRDRAGFALPQYAADTPASLTQGHPIRLVAFPSRVGSSHPLSNPMSIPTAAKIRPVLTWACRWSAQRSSAESSRNVTASDTEVCSGGRPFRTRSWLSHRRRKPDDDTLADIRSSPQDGNRPGPLTLCGCIHLTEAGAPLP